MKWISACRSGEICLDGRSLPAALTELQSLGFEVYGVDAGHVHDEESFIRAFMTMIPSDPPYFEVDPNRSPCWDAVWDSLSPLGDDTHRHAIVVTQGEILLERNVNCLLEFIGVLRSIAAQRGTIINLLIFGSGPNFQDPFQPLQH